MPEWLQPQMGDTWWPAADLVVRVVAAVLLGGLIGLEREIRDKPAGFRTIVLISLGACIFTIISDIAGGRDQQSTRIAAQVVTGIGFLGAGAILRDRVNVIGLTTAATIWSVAAIGMAAGFGLLKLAMLGTVGILLTLMLFNFVEDSIGTIRDIQEFEIQTANSEGAIERVLDLFRNAGLKIKKKYYYEVEGELVVHVFAMGAKPKHDNVRLTVIRSKEFTLRKSLA